MPHGGVTVVGVGVMAALRAVADFAAVPIFGSLGSRSFLARYDDEVEMTMMQ